MYLLELFWETEGGWWTVEITCTCLGGFLLGGSNAEKCGDHQKKNFFINNSVGLSMCDGPIKTVKYIWVNILCMLHWILSQNCRNTLSLACKILDAVAPGNLFAANADAVAYCLFILYF